MLDEIIRSDIESRFFERVDSFLNPLALVDPDCVGGALGELKLAETSVRKVCDQARSEALQPYIVDRRLSGPFAKNTYEYCLNIQPGGFEKIVNIHRDNIRAEVLSAFDSGCGEGHALEQMLELDAIDAQGSIGITMHSMTRVPEKVIGRVLRANIAGFAPKKFQGVPKRFDILTSVYGTMDYHPLNRNCKESDYSFGILHAINFIKVGGLIFTNWASYLRSRSIAELIKLGILEKTKDFDAFSIKPRIGPAIFKVSRRPTLAEIKKILRVEGNTVL